MLPRRALPVGQLCHRAEHRRDRAQIVHLGDMESIWFSYGFHTDDRRRWRAGAFSHGCRLKCGPQYFRRRCLGGVLGGRLGGVPVEPREPPGHPQYHARNRRQVPPGAAARTCPELAVFAARRTRNTMRGTGGSCGPICPEGHARNRRHLRPARANRAGGLCAWCQARKPRRPVLSAWR